MHPAVATSSDYFLVPWLLQLHPHSRKKQRKLLQKHLQGRAQSSWHPVSSTGQCVRMRFTFPLCLYGGSGSESQSLGIEESSESGLPAGLFSRLQACLYRHCDELMPEVVRDAAVLRACKPERGEEEGKEVVAVLVRREVVDDAEEEAEEEAEAEAEVLPGGAQHSWGATVDVIGWYQPSKSSSSSSGATSSAVSISSDSRSWRVFELVVASLREQKERFCAGQVMREKVVCPHCCANSLQEAEAEGNLGAGCHCWMHLRCPRFLTGRGA